MCQRATLWRRSGRLPAHGPHRALVQCHRGLPARRARAPTGRGELRSEATMKKYIQYPRVAGTRSRQAHADLPKGSFEREMGKEGFYGPASFFYHRHPPTGWSHFEGPLRPHAFDLNKLARAPASPWEAP